MIHKLYVFTSTGNSLWLAKETAARLREADPEAQVEILSIPALMKDGVWAIDGDTAGFVFPCYYGSTPRIVTDFVRGAADVEAPYAWAFVSGGGTIGKSHSALDTALRARGAALSLGAGVTIASNYMNGWYYEAIFPDDTEFSRRLAQAERSAADLALRIGERATGWPRESAMRAFLPRLLTPSRYVRDTRPWAREFAASAACTGCGECARMCPVGNVVMGNAAGNATPTFGGNCERCMACMQFCPSGALSILGKPMNKRKYRNPNIVKSELAAFNRG